MNVFWLQSPVKHLKLPHFRLWLHSVTSHTDEKENKIFLIYTEIQSGAVAKSSMTKGFLIYHEMRKYLVIDEEAVSHKWLCNRSLLDYIIHEDFFISAGSSRKAIRSITLVCVTSLWYPEHQQNQQHPFVCCLQNCIMINQYWHSSKFIGMYVSRSSWGPLYYTHKLYSPWVSLHISLLLLRTKYQFYLKYERLEGGIFLFARILKKSLLWNSSKQ
jgi:hypothetical protein